MSGNMTFTPEQVVLPLMTLLPTDGWLDVCQASLGPAGYMASYVILRLVDGFRHHALPFLTDAELEVIRGKLRARLGPPGYPSDPYQTFPFACHLAAATGMHEEILAIVRTIPDDLYVGPNWGDHYHRPQDLIFGLALKQA
jgi:hypothetical protein